MSTYLELRRAMKNGTVVKADKKPVPIPKRSEKMEVKMKEYGPKRKAFLARAENRICKSKIACSGARATDIHHMSGRSGEMLMDEKGWLSVCRSCHTYITEHSAEAIEKGHSRSRLKKEK